MADPPAEDIFGNPIYLAADKAVAYGTGAFAGIQQRVNFWQETCDPGAEPNPCNAAFNPDDDFRYPLPMLPVKMHVEGYKFIGD